VRVLPKKISIKDKRYLHIEWDDGSESMIALASLRRNCPCATCKAEHEKQPATYMPLYSTASLTLTNIKPVGTYGVQLFWQDGHNTGIYTYERLKDWKS
jgi:DUF971 family protein